MGDWFATKPQSAQSNLVSGYRGESECGARECSTSTIFPRKPEGCQCFVVGELEADGPPHPPTLGLGIKSPFTDSEANLTGLTYLPNAPAEEIRESAAFSLMIAFDQVTDSSSHSHSLPPPLLTLSVPATPHSTG